MAVLLVALAVAAALVMAANAYEWLRDKPVRDYERCMPRYGSERGRNRVRPFVKLIWVAALVVVVATGNWLAVAVGTAAGVYGFSE